MSEKNNAVYIKEVTITDYKCFKGENKFSFYDENDNWCQWTVFLGNNNTGKTNLLKAISSMEPIIDPSNKFSMKNLYIHYIKDFFKYEIVITTANEFDTLLLRHTGHNIWFTKPSIKKWCENLKIYGYGVVREVEDKGISNNDSTKDSLLDGTKLINFESWLFQLDYSVKNATTNYSIKEANRRLNIIKEIITSEIFPEIDDIRFITDENLKNYLEFKTQNGWFNFSALGYGYQSTLSWMVDFCKKMFDRYPDSENPLKEPAVVLIDEIDLHLHPQWQRNIIKYLSNIFTKTQFIVTTHSPFVIQSMEKVNLYTLHHYENCTRVKHWQNQSFIGWRIEEILSEVMDLKENINTDAYQQLMNDFDKALDSNNLKAAQKAYTQLAKILHPLSEERKLLEIQLSQIVPDND